MKSAPSEMASNASKANTRSEGSIPNGKASVEANGKKHGSRLTEKHGSRLTEKHGSRTEKHGVKSVEGFKSKGREPQTKRPTIETVTSMVESVP